LAAGELGDVVADALFRQTGVIRAETLEEMIALASGLANQPMPRGRRVAIVTNAGGPAVLCTDACEGAGLVVPELSASTGERLRQFLPGSAAVKNPVDLIASATPDQYANAIATLLADEDIDALIVLYISVDVADTEAIARGIISGITTARGGGAKAKPVLACWMAEGDPDRRLVVNGEQIPTYPLPEMPARVLSKAAAYAEWRAKPLGVVLDFEDMDLGAAQRLCREVLARRGTGWLTVDETRAVLGLAALPLIPGAVAATPKEAVSLAERFGFPVAVKLASHRLVHKTEVGGVRLNVREAEGVREAFAAIRAGVQQYGDPEAMDGVLIQPMLAGGVELMMGLVQDPLFGPLVAFGLGGIHVEILKDVRFRVTPLTDRDAQEMVAEIKGYRLLEGYRGHPPADIMAIQETLLRLSRLVEAVSEIVELDLNPVFALPPGKGCRVADARIRVGTS
jgi:acyl-CoA synthetase (NDP forming)